MAEKELHVREMRVVFPAFDETVPIFANHLTAQFMGNEYVISFFAAMPPRIFDSPEESATSAGEETTVPARCVAKVVVGRDRLPDFLRILQEMVDRVTSLGKGQEAEPREGDG